MGLYQMDALEIAGGWINGYDEVAVPAGRQPGPRQVLDGMLTHALARSPCLVAFSGGRDSSALLAAAVDTARREGLPLPVPITLTFPGAPDADEAGWQQAVLDHLGITERVLLPVRQQHDPVGPVMTPLLARHGVIWPPNIAPTWRMLDRARGGVLLTGDGGDEVYGRKRITPVTKLLKARGRVRPRVYRDAAQALLPAALRRRISLRDRYRRPWLREPVDTLLARRDADDLAVYSRHAGRHAWQYATRRAATRGYETVRTLGGELGVEYVQAFAEPGFVAAVAAAAGFWGWTGRTATMRALFGDLLPRAVLERRTKATFNGAVFTEHARRFARGWNGEGVDAELVDPEALRACWLAERPPAPSMALLQQAWLASRGRAVGGAAAPGVS